MTLAEVFALFQSCLTEIIFYFDDCFSVENNVILLNLIVNSVEHFAFLFKYKLKN